MRIKSCQPFTQPSLYKDSILLFEKDASQESETLYLVIFVQQKERGVSRVRNSLLTIFIQPTNYFKSWTYFTTHISTTAIIENERKGKMRFKSLRLFVRPSFHNTLGLNITKRQVGPPTERKGKRCVSRV